MEKQSKTSTMNILIVGAHPDDYELGMAGTIRKHVSNKDNVFSIIMSNGEIIGDTEMRKKEAIKSANYLGIKKTYFLNFKDTRVPSGINAIKELEKIIVKTKSTEFILTR